MSEIDEVEAALADVSDEESFRAALRLLRPVVDTELAYETDLGDVDAVGDGDRAEAR